MADQIDETVQRMLKEMVDKLKLSQTGIMRGIDVMRNIQDILLKYNAQGKIDDPLSVVEMEKEIVIILAKEFDRNFYEGMMDAMTHATAAIMKIPQVQELNNEVIAKASKKLASDSSPGAEKIRNLLNKLGINLGQSGAQTTEASASLDNFASPRSKKEDLN